MQQTRTSWRGRAVLSLLTLLLCALAQAQDALPPEATQHGWDVFLQGDAGNTDAHDVTFVDLLTGASSTVATTGERYSLLETGLQYFDSAADEVKWLKPDGIIRPHPFINKSPRDERVEWMVAPDRRYVAWVTSRVTGEGQRSHVLRLADIASGETRVLLRDAARVKLHLVPVYVEAGGQRIILAVQAEGSAAHTQYPRQSSLLELTLGEGPAAARALSRSPACLCALGIGSEVLLWVAPKGAAVTVQPLAQAAVTEIVPPDGDISGEPGNVLLSPDGSLAVYALTEVRAAYSEQPQRRSRLVLVDWQAGIQRLFDYRADGLLAPLRWTEDNSALLFSGYPAGGTWKLRLRDGQVQKLSDAQYLGTIYPSA